MMQKNEPACRAATEKSLSLYPNNQEAIRSRGVLSILCGNPEAAIPDIERAMRIDPGQDHRNLQFLGTAHLLLGNYELAATIFRERIRIVPDTDIGRAMLVSTLGHLGELEEAKRVWGELMELKPDYSVTVHVNSVFHNAEYGRAIIEGFEKAGLPV
jgi:adenylate cyclase